MTKGFQEEFDAIKILVNSATTTFVAGIGTPGRSRGAMSAWRLGRRKAM